MKVRGEGEGKGRSFRDWEIIYSVQYMGGKGAMVNH